MTTTPDGILRLSFDPGLDTKGELHKGLSAVVQIGRTLWVANDETISLERLVLGGEDPAAGEVSARGHERFSLDGYLDLPAPATGGKKAKEIDIEGLAFDGRHLWVVGSHSLNRKKADPDKDGVEKARETLEAEPKKEGNRYLLARIPVAEEEGVHTPPKQDDVGRPTGAQLRGDSTGNDLTAAVREDVPLKAFLDVPGKENGFDVEGLAVAGGRLFIGLRGPVLRGWAVILEVEVTEEAAEGGAPSLRLVEIGPGGRAYRKHYVQLGGLGVRDLCVVGEDLLILAGPTMELSGPVAVFRWKGGAAPVGESMIARSALERIIEVPFGDGEDHAEGITPFSPDGDEPRALLVVYDSASGTRSRPEDGSITADLFPLPAS
ncbi:MAG TPA: DUF3616 domain-containing protein [Longimicrobium sp.]|jgi:hypothetical protein